LDSMTIQARRAGAEDDLWEGVDPNVVTEAILTTMLGAQLLSKTADGIDHIQATNPIPGTFPAGHPDRHIAALLPEFLARESLRHAPDHRLT
jgi:hypothetical protein